MKRVKSNFSKYKWGLTSDLIKINVILTQHEAIILYKQKFGPKVGQVAFLGAINRKKGARGGHEQ